jgi:hypothetical protein
MKGMTRKLTAWKEEFDMKLEEKVTSILGKRLYDDQTLRKRRFLTMMNQKAEKTEFLSFNPS